MKEHAIPQDITGYKFHIVGNMTLKQFAEVALGFVIAFFLYKTNLYFPIKWFLIALSAGFGAALAFLPIEERPLDHWFVTFFTILYKPTKFYWKKEPKIPEAFIYKSNKDAKTQAKTIDLTPQRRARISEYLQSVKIDTEDDQEEIYYKQRADQLLSIFNDHSLKINYKRSEKLNSKPDLKVKVRSLIGTNKEVSSQLEPVLETVSSSNNSNNFALPNSNILENQQQEYQPMIKKAVSTKTIASEISIPETENIHIESTHKQEQQINQIDSAQTNNIVQQDASYLESETTNQNIVKASTTVTTNKDLPFPTRPTKPNKLVGMIVTQSNDLINDAIITLRDEGGKPITAIKSNALGQFFITSQLANGIYNIVVKKSGHSFSPINITLEGKTISPLEIRSNE